MKISKIFAGMSALAIASTMVVSASAATNKTNMWTVQASWNADAPADKEKTPVKFTFNEDGTPVEKKGATDLSNWDSGGTKFNGQWAQFIMTDDDLDAITIKATIVADGDTTWEYHPADPEKSDEENVYIVFNFMGSPNTVSTTTSSAELNKQIEAANADATENQFYNATGTWEVEYSGADLKKAVEDGGAQFTENGDGTYTFGCNIQVGHMKNAKVTLEVTSTKDNIYDGPETESPADDNESGDAKKEDTKKEDTKKEDNKSDAKEEKGGATGGATGGNTTGGSTAGGSDSNSNAGTGSGSAAATTNTSTGSSAGLALAGLALAGAAIVATKKR
ncbi:MAG: NPXTG-anchored protein [Ruminococcus sp.]|nr:NPXTG-anchored protein [Ruminococcus sp.]